MEVNRQLNELAEEAKAAAEVKMQLENDLKDAQAPIKLKERERGLLSRELAQEKKKHSSAVRRLEQARRQILESQGNVAEEERVRTRKIAQIETDLSRARDQVEPLREEVNKYYREYTDIDPAVNQAKETMEGTERQVAAVQQKMNAMQQESRDGMAALAVFGSKCKALYEVSCGFIIFSFDHRFHSVGLIPCYTMLPLHIMQAVQRATNAKKFQGPIAGPVGMYVKIVHGKETYAKIAEAAIGPGALDRFIVTNQADLQLMNKLRRDVGCGPRDCPLYRISPKATKQKYNVPESPPGVETVTSVLNVENAMAFNFLVDHANIDTSALADSKESSERALLVRESNGKCSIKGGKVRKVFFLPNGDYWEARMGNMMMVGNDRGMKQTIGVDRSAALESTKHELVALQKEMARNKQELKEVKDAAYKAQKAWNVANDQNKKLTSRIKEMEATLDKLRDEAETSEEAPTIDTSEYERDIQESDAAVQDLKKKEALTVKDIEFLQPAVEECRKQLDVVTSRNSKILNEMEKLDEKLDDIVKGQTRRMDQLDKVRAKVEQMQAAVNQQECIVSEIKGKVNEALAGAQKMQFSYNRDARMYQLKEKNGGELPPGEEVELEPTNEDLEGIEIVEPPNDSKHYKSKLQNKLKKIEQEKQRRNMSESDPAVARDKYFRAKKDLDSKMKQINMIETNVKALTDDLKERKKMWRQFRGHIAEQTNLGFDEFLNKKGSAGEVEFDHENKRLNLVVQKVRLSVFSWFLLPSLHYFH